MENPLITNYIFKSHRLLNAFFQISKTWPLSWISKGQIVFIIIHFQYLNYNSSIYGFIRQLPGVVNIIVKRLTTNKKNNKLINI